ncbi:MAG: hypothetical protein WC755_09800 [Candidatus Woesearchaeota archaeon]|jgi:hypothetical protein
MLSENECLILDRHGTLTDSDEPAQIIFEGVEVFLQEQLELRRCVIATAALGTDIPPKLIQLIGKQNIFGTQKIGERRDIFYLQNDGQIKKLFDDYEYVQTGSKRLLLRKKIRTPFDGNTLQTPFDESALYINNASPNILHSKDIELLKRFLVGNSYAKLKTVLIGDSRHDVKTLASDPQTPGIIITDRQWATRQRIRLLLNNIFNPSQNPDAVFDSLYKSGEAFQRKNRKLPFIDIHKKSKLITLEDCKFEFMRGEEGQRIISEEEIK